MDVLALTAASLKISAPAKVLRLAGTNPLGNGSQCSNIGGRLQGNKV